MSRRDDNDYEEEEEEVDYHEHQREYGHLEKEWEARKDWSDGDEAGHLEKMKFATEQEREGREKAREWGSDDDGHEDRIASLKGSEQILGHMIGHHQDDAEGNRYQYETRRMEAMDVNERRELEAENTQEESERRSRWIQSREEEQEEQEDDAEEESSDMDIDEDDD